MQLSTFRYTKKQYTYQTNNCILGVAKSSIPNVIAASVVMLSVMALFLVFPPIMSQPPLPMQTRLGQLKKMKFQNVKIFLKRILKHSNSKNATFSIPIHRETIYISDK